jgi:hypothetical protein
MRIGFKEISFAAVAALAIAVTMGSAQAQHWHRGYGGGWGPGAGFVGGLAVGSAIGAGPYYRSYAYGDCYIQRRVVFNRFGERIIRRVRICE